MNMGLMNLYLNLKPDLMIIDGGKGHLSAALEGFLQLGLDDVPLASLAKENEELKYLFYKIPENLRNLKLKTVIN